ncbi:hypothetical protein [Microbacterium resistens]
MATVTAVPEDECHVSIPAAMWMRREIRRLLNEVHRLTVERDHWYLRAMYTPDEIAEMRRRATLGLDENGQWLWPDGERTGR